jgi:hypothetical protein
MEMIELRLPRLEYRLESGVIALRDGIVVTFFLPHSHAGVAVAVRRAFDAFLRLPALPTAFTTVREGEPVPAADVTAIADEALDPSRAESHMHLLDSADHAPRFSVRYHGLDLETRAREGWGDAVSGIRFTFPTDYLGPSGLVEIFGFASELSDILPMSFGYVAPAFVFLEGIGEDGAFTVIRGLCRRYQCLDIPALLPDCFEVGTGPKGAYWGNYLSARLVERMGGEPAVRSHFTGLDVKIDGTGNGGILLYLDPYPIAGDVNRQEDVGRYAAAARLFRPLMRPRRVPYMNFDEEMMFAWLTRFSDEERR